MKQRDTDHAENIQIQLLICHIVFFVCQKYMCGTTGTAEPFFQLAVAYQKYKGIFTARDSATQRGVNNHHHREQSEDASQDAFTQL